MLNELIKIMNNRQMVSIYGDENDYDYYFSGYIQAVDESGLLLSKQNYGGYNNGFVFFTNIVYFEIDTIDTKRHEKLLKIHNIEPETFDLQKNIELFDEIIDKCLKNQLCCDILKKENDEGDQIGFISEAYDSYIVVKCIDKYGEYYGKSFIEKSDIFRIFIEGEYEQAAKLLYIDRYGNDI